MRIVLRADVANVGRKGDVLEVADGYARNYLVPRGLALRASPGAITQADSMRRARQLKEDRDRESAEELARRLTSTAVRIPARVGAEGRLFGSVTAADIAEALQAQTGASVDRRRIHLDDPIRAAGVHQVAVRLHADVETAVTVEVVAAGS